MAYVTDAERWRALTTRDANSEGHFIYSIKSTNIYCRPACPGRLARRANVSFYSTPVEAEAAGFRACKRCKPNAVLEDPQERAVEKAQMLIDEALSKDDQKSLKLQDLAKKINRTPRYFHKIFKNKTGMTPKEYAKKRAADRSSLNAAPASTTTTEESAQSWNWDACNFNDLVNLRTDSSHTSMETFLMPTEQLPAIYTDVDFDLVGVSQPWADWTSLWPFDWDSPVDHIPARMYSHEKNLPSASFLETDAAALFECDSLTELLKA
ncbi:Ada Adenosine deaminase [Pyrenophora tritici-repentis]|uniref:Ada, Adenosine deaminase n=1 Tax=Pyrenophora tritici-repentis TaxID=45151 RepID=A0A2W1FET8_9PLEO|nr:DNA repair and transcription factor Ada [Pyrenophora tritici-repentis]KAF7446228.1 DNA repair and transcription factor Ada [Pyrenophora tritici-repentis]KAF7567330.1 Ada, Adenosine deaminase [Pyrenophora tritici-repentis]KAG9381930.1 DNA repair and transcription factor Ada [Pyrenophora tritici-repentis]KAI0573905.1 DNA repair and transcription factor Ada [Pyrenophora tritici-repentis]